MANYDYSGQMRPEQMHYTNQPHPQGGYDYSDEMHEYEDAPRAAGLSRIVNALGAVASLALVAGIGVWGYKLVMRDVSGVPVVRAVEGPMRIQPENPGGTPADHQGLAVNTVAAVGTAAPPADRLILAPRPVSLTDEDTPVEPLRATPAVHVVEEEISNQEAAQLRQGAVDALVAELAGEAKTPDTETDEGVQLASLAPLDDEPAIDPADLAAQLPDPAIAALPGVRRSLRPNTRPARTTASGITASSKTEDAINAAVKAAVGLDVDPNALSKGTRMAQLGAYESPDVARAEWDRLNGRFGEYMDGKQRVIQKTSSGGRTFYRLRVLGFDDLSDSRQFCAALQGQGADCIPVAAR
ncbi:MULTISPECIES: SPOR domain-containing protein [unclassified Ruegeria]|uniref:SPOR domain-containing protein n=1 Tax=unclassified Ruegeria TaxID=2625375 RepID=UPI001ADA634D|nr:MULTISPECIES: SPOR domain-containing protein [unclassified Ruegeria]MBO9410470.1 SPOR domain-containing protein [Ruegeria sp. R8_1]MBO9414311.1 SPOR domain-containing protein [Ruegeria sp. R8_2]